MPDAGSSVVKSWGPFSRQECNQRREGGPHVWRGGTQVGTASRCGVGRSSARLSSYWNKVPSYALRFFIIRTTKTPTAQSPRAASQIAVVSPDLAPTFWAVVKK